MRSRLRPRFQAVWLLGKVAVEATLHGQGSEVVPVMSMPLEAERTSPFCGQPFFCSFHLLGSFT